MDNKKSNQEQLEVINKKLANRNLVLTNRKVIAETAKLKAETELFEEQSRTKRLYRVVMRVTALISGLTFITSLLNHLGWFNK